MKGPPFSVDDGEVRSLFATCQSVDRLSSESIIETEPRFRERGLSTLIENAYLIVR
jgi:thiopurine S-methyltransferase